MAKKLERCSVLMCVYEGDKPEYLRMSLDSLATQSVKPDEIVVVVNGDILESAKKILSEFNKKFKLMTTVYLPQNVGVGEASNIGLEKCQNELVAKMDADDIAAPKRLEHQLMEFSRREDLVLLGGQLAEFADNNPKKIISYRKVPTSLVGIKKFVRRRSPFNNQTVMFKKSVVQTVGGYPKLNRAEDYYLYAKIIAANYVVDNLAEVLVYYRLNPETLARRKSWQNTKEMIGARNEIRKLGVSKLSDLAITTLAQVCLFVLPLTFTKWFYGRIRKNG